MVHEHFGLERMPFSSAPDQTLLVNLPAVRDALSRSMNCIASGSGISVIIGQSGCGKSLLLEKLAADFAEQFRVINLVCPRVRSRLELLQNILFQLGKPFKSGTEGELRLALMDYLEPSDECPQGILLLVDEAHLLPQPLLEELRQITNVVRNGAPRVRLVIAGSYPLEERLTHPKLDAFNQRITCRVYLNALTRDETHLFVISQIQICGGDGRNLMEPAALAAVHEISQGVPRLINQVCHHALIDAAQASEKQISAERINRTWAELQCIPYAGSSPSLPNHRPDDSFIEFGSLESDETEEKTPTPPSESSAFIEFGSADSGDTDAFAEAVEAEPKAEDQQPLAGFDPKSLIEGQLVDDTSQNEMVEYVERPEATLRSLGNAEPGSAEVAFPIQQDDSREGDSHTTAPEPAPAASSGEAQSEFEVIKSFHNVGEIESQAQIDSLMTELSGLESGDQAAHESPGAPEAASPEQRHLASSDLSDPAAVPFLSPTPERSPRSEPTSHTAQDPFGEDFAEEEAVADQYAELGSALNRSSMEIASSELSVLESHAIDSDGTVDAIQFVSRDPAADGAQPQHSSSDDPPQELESQAESAGSVDSIEIPSLAVERPITEHLPYQHRDIQVPESADQPEDRLEGTEPAQDDRDMIIVSNQEMRVSSATPEDQPEANEQKPSKGQAIRIELKDLFNQLRSFENEA